MATYSYGYDPKKVIEKKESKLQVWGGPIKEWAEVMPDIVIDLAGTLRPDDLRVVRVYGFDGPLPFLKHAKEPKLIKVEWPDFSTPPLGKAFWKELAKYLLKTGGKVYVGCTGGKGRTGTALAILGNLIEGWDQPITEVRKRLTEDAVESQSQVKYVQKITGTKEDVEPAGKSYSYGSYGNYGSYSGGSYGNYSGAATGSGAGSETPTDEIVDSVVDKIGDDAIEAIEKQWLIVAPDEKYDQTTIIGIATNYTLTRYKGGKYSLYRHEQKSQVAIVSMVSEAQIKIELERFLRREIALAKLIAYGLGEDPTDGWKSYKVGPVMVMPSGTYHHEGRTITYAEAVQLVKASVS